MLDVMTYESPLLRTTKKTTGGLATVDPPLSLARTRPLVSPVHVTSTTVPELTTTLLGNDKR